jgi:glycosyltransferase involved in cell wall biosynthesis
MGSPRRKIMVLVDWFEPGFKAGGPIRSVVNLVQNLKDQYDISVLTADRDLGSVYPYPGIETGKWLQMEGYTTFYARPTDLSWKFLRDIILEVDPDVIILNSMFSRYYSFYPVLINRIYSIRAKFIIAPRGMLKDSAVSRKSLKKKTFLRIYRFLGLHSKLVFLASDEREKGDVIRWFGKRVSVQCIPNFPAQVMEFIPPPHKERGRLAMIFVGRVHPIKNLELLIDALSVQTARIDLSIVAPVEDVEYWDQCTARINELPYNITVKHFEYVPHDKVRTLLIGNHIFVLPTRGENFGHAIFEALAAGRPSLISDQTPWRDLEKRKAGWDVGISDSKEFAEKISAASDFDNDQMYDWCFHAWQFSREYSRNNLILDKYVKLVS